MMRCILESVFDNVKSILYYPRFGSYMEEAEEANCAIAAD